MKNEYNYHPQMFVVVKETEDANGESQGKTFSDFISEAEAKEEYEKVILEPNVTYASYGEVDISTMYKYAKS